MTRAIVCSVESVEAHPNADRLEVLTLHFGPSIKPVQVVTGPHYLAGLHGVYFPPGALIPGYLAEDLWLKGGASSNCWTPIGTKNMRGVESPGMFAGEMYQKVRTDPRSVKLARKRGAKPDQDWIQWPYWRDRWQIGEDVSAYLGVMPEVEKPCTDVIFEALMKKSAELKQSPM